MLRWMTMSINAVKVKIMSNATFLAGLANVCPVAHRLWTIQKAAQLKCVLRFVDLDRLQLFIIIQM